MTQPGSGGLGKSRANVIMRPRRLVPLLKLAVAEQHHPERSLPPQSPALTSKAQMMRAILLARATLTSIFGLRANICASHDPLGAPRRVCFEEGKPDQLPRALH